MIIKEIKYEDVAGYLDESGLMNVSPEYISFCRDYWKARPIFLGFFGADNTLSAILPLFKWKENGLAYLGTSLKLYSEPIFLKDINIDLKEMIKFIKKFFVFDVLDLSFCPIIGENNRIFLGKNWRTAVYILKTSPGLQAENLLKAIDKKTRNQIKKSEKFNFSKELGQDIEKFYPLYCEAMIRLRAKPKDKKYFLDLRTFFGENFHIIFAKKGERICGVNLWVIKNHYLSLLFNASIKDFWPYCINDFLYWETIKFGLVRGVNFFDFGVNAKRDKDQIHFKAGFDAKPFPVYHFVVLKSFKAFIKIYKNKLIFLFKIFFRK